MAVVSHGALVDKRFSRQGLCRVEARQAGVLTGRLFSAGGRGRSCGPGCAAPVAAALAALSYRWPMTFSSVRGCALTCSLSRSFSSRSSPWVSAGVWTAPSAFTYRLLTFRDSLLTWNGERYPSEGISSMKPYWRSLDVSDSSRQLSRFSLLGRKGAVQGIDVAASCRFGEFQSWGGGKSVLSVRRQQTLSFRGRLRENASCVRNVGPGQHGMYDMGTGWRQGRLSGIRPMRSDRLLEQREPSSNCPK